MSASGAGSARVRRLFDWAKNAGSIGGVILQGLSAILLAIGGALASGVLTLAAYASGAADLTESFLVASVS